MQEVRLVNRYALFLVVATLLHAGVCLAQPPAPPEGQAAKFGTSVVTVIAPPTPAIIEQQAQAFVKSYAATPNPNLNQIGRWHDPVCVEVLGLPQAAQAAKIKARIETMAQSLGLPAASASFCKPNVEIAFEDDPQGAMNGVSKSREVQYLLGYYHLSRAKQLRTVKHPIQAWYVTATHTDGVNTAAFLGYGVPDAIDDPESAPPVGCYYRFTACSLSAFYNVLIVADNKALRGDKLSTVTDDLVMLALSEPKSLDGCYALPSVIDRYAKSPCTNRAPPDGLTSADTAYLSALYSADLEARKNPEQVDLSSRMAKMLIQGHAEARDNGEGSPPSVKAQ